MPAAPLWIPQPADPGSAEEPIRSRLLPALPIVVLIAALATAVVVGGPRLLGTDSPATSEPAAAPAKREDDGAPVKSEADAAPAISEPTAAPAESGPAGSGPAAAPAESAPILEKTSVTVDPSVTDPLAPAVAAMFGVFFSGINERDYDAVAGVLDPAGELDPGAPGQMAAFAEGTATTRDSNIVLRDLTRAASGRLRAEVTFRSEQRAGHGPPARLAETCTRWKVRYTLSSRASEHRSSRAGEHRSSRAGEHRIPRAGQHRILRADATDEPC